MLPGMRSLPWSWLGFGGASGAGAEVPGFLAVRARWRASPPPPPPAPSVRGAAPWDTTTVADGSHTLGATATDQAGTTASTTRVVIVDNTPPGTVITSAPPGAVNTSPLPLGFTGTANPTPAANLPFAS